MTGKRVHWYDEDAHMIPPLPSTAVPAAAWFSHVPTVQGRDCGVMPLGDTERACAGDHGTRRPSVTSTTTTRTLPAAPTRRIQREFDKLSRLYQRMESVRRKVHDLGRDMDHQLQETRQTNELLEIIQAVVEQLRLETEEYDRQLEAYYEYEQKFCPRTRPLPERNVA